MPSPLKSSNLLLVAGLIATAVSLGSYVGGLWNITDMLTSESYWKYWLAKFAFLGPVAILIWFLKRAGILGSQGKRGIGVCRKCGYSLRDNQSGNCPECGSVVLRGDLGRADARKYKNNFSVATVAQIIATWILIWIVRDRIYPQRAEPVIFSMVLAACLLVTINRIRTSEWASGGYSPVLFFSLVIAGICIIILLPFFISRIAGW